MKTILFGGDWDLLTKESITTMLSSICGESWISLRLLLLCTEMKILGKKRLLPFWLNKKQIFLYMRNPWLKLSWESILTTPGVGLSCLKLWHRNKNIVSGECWDKWMNEYYAAVIKTKTIYDSPLLSTRDKFQSQSMPETKPKPYPIHIHICILCIFLYIHTYGKV